MKHLRIRSRTPALNRVRSPPSGVRREGTIARLIAGGAQAFQAGEQADARGSSVKAWRAVDPPIMTPASGRPYGGQALAPGVRRFSSQALGREVVQGGRDLDDVAAGRGCGRVPSPRPDRRRSAGARGSWMWMAKVFAGMRFRRAIPNRADRRPHVMRISGHGGSKDLGSPQGSNQRCSHPLGAVLLPSRGRRSRSSQAAGLRAHAGFARGERPGGDHRASAPRIRAGCRIRTRDLRFTKALLYQLS